MADDRNIAYNYSANVSDYTAGLAQATKATSALDSSLAAVNAQSGKFGKALTGMVIGGAGLIGMKQGTLVAAQYEKELSTLKATTKVANQNFGALSKTITTLSKDFPQTFGDSRQVVTTMNQITAVTKRTDQDLAKLATTVTKLSGATGEWAPGLAKDFGLISKQFGNLDPKRFTAMADSLTAVSAKMGTSASSVAQFSKLIGPLAQQAGMGQNAVQGVAAAFTSLGEEGYRSASAFNQIMSMMNRTVRDGGPELQFFSDLVGQTTKNFGDLFKSNPAEAMATLFDSIARGGPQAARQLESIGLDSTSIQRQFALLSQSGAMRESIQTAVEATGGGATEEGAGAAFGGLSDSMMKLEETSRQLAAALGGPLLGPMTALLEIVNKLASVATKIAESPIGKVVTAGAGIAGSAFGAMTTVAMGAIALRSKPVQGILGGFAAGLGGEGRIGRFGERVMDRYTGNQLGRLGTSAFEATHRFGAGLAGIRASFQGDPDAPRTSWGQRARIGSNVFAAGMGGMYSSVFRQGRGAEGGAYYGGYTGVGKAMATAGAEAKEEYKKAAGDKATPLGAMQAQAKAMAAELGKANAAIKAGTAAHIQNSSATGNSTKSSVVLATAFKRLTVETVTFGASLAKIAGTAALSGIASLGKGLGVMGVATAAIGVGMFAKGQVDKEKKENAAATARLADPISTMRAYNDSLGIATRQVNGFGDSLENAATSVVTLAEAMDISYSDLQAAQKRETQIATFGKGSPQWIAQQIGAQFGGELTAAQLNTVMVDVVKQFGTETAKQVTAQFNVEGNKVTLDTDSQGLMKNLIKEANKPGDYGEDNIEKGVSAALATAETERQRNEQMYGSDYADSQYRKQVSQLASLVPDLKTANDRQAAYTDLLIGQTGLDKGKAVDIAQNISAGRYGWAHGQFIASRQAQGESTTGLERNIELYNAGEITDEEMERIITDKYGPQAWDQFRGVTTGVKVTGAARQRAYDLTRGAIAPGAEGNREQITLPGATSATPLTVSELMLGGTVKPAETALAQPGSKSAQYQGAKAVIDAAKKAGVPIEELMAGAALTAATTGPGAGQELALATQAQAGIGYGQQLRSLSSGGAYQMQSNVNAAILAPIQAKIDKNEELNESEQTLYETTVSNQDQLDAEREQYLKGIIKMYQQHNVQMGRMQEDYNTSVARAQHDFNESMKFQAEDYHKSVARAEEDYNLSRANANRDFNRQMQWAQKDYNKQRMRAQRDFDKAMARQAEDAAKAFYDPYKRIQVQAVWDTQSLLGNLTEQNEAMRKQRDQLEQLKALGVSQQTIDMLGLAETQNAQQLSQMLADIQMDPNQIAALNRAAQERAAMSGDLLSETTGYRRAKDDFDTQMADMESDFNEQIERQRVLFETQMADMATAYNKQMARAEADYNTSVERAHAKFSYQLGLMNQDYNKAVARAKEDLRLATTEITGTLETLTETSAQLMSDNMDAFNTTVTDGLDETLRAIKERSPEMLEALAAAGLGGWTYDPKSGGYMPGGQGGGTPGTPRADGRFVEGTGSFTPPVAMSWPAPTSGGGESANTKAAMQFALETFKGMISSAGGYRPADPNVSFRSDHPRGKAADLMIPNWQSTQGQRNGQAIANWFTQNANVFGTKMVIWRDQANTGKGWKPYGHPDYSGATAQHRDHVHVSFLQKGGIATRPIFGVYGEAGPETVLPLDNRGARFFAEVMKRYVEMDELRAAFVRPYASPVTQTSSSISSYDQRQQFHGPVTVQAQDPEMMGRKLAQKARRMRLTRSPLEGR